MQSNNNEIVKFLVPFCDVNIHSMNLTLPLNVATLYNNVAAAEILVPFTDNHNLQKLVKDPFTSTKLKQIINEEITKRGI